MKGAGVNRNGLNRNSLNQSLNLNATGKPGGGRKEALGPQALRCRDCQLATGEGSVPDPRANLRGDQLPAGRGAATHIGASLDIADLTDLQARVDCLLKENGELKTKVEEGEVLHKETKELKDRITALEAEVKSAREEWNKAKEVARKIHNFMGYPGDVINKARLYD